jgi:hypothetical protein
MARVRKPVTHMSINPLQGWVDITIKGSFSNLDADYKAIRKAVCHYQPNAHFNTPKHVFDCDEMKDTYNFRITVCDRDATDWLKSFDRDGTAAFASLPAPLV